VGGGGEADNIWQLIFKEGGGGVWNVWHWQLMCDTGQGGGAQNIVNMAYLRYLRWVQPVITSVHKVCHTLRTGQDSPIHHEHIAFKGEQHPSLFYDNVKFVK